MQLTAFSIVVALFWGTVFGYPLSLVILTKLRRTTEKRHAGGQLPSVAVVIPTYNEEKFIRSKIRDLLLTNYPSELLSILVVDGCSQDRTVELARREQENFPRLEVRTMLRSRGKADQINQVVPTLDQEIVIVSDADSRLDPDCIGELVRLLTADSNLGIAGATVLPNTNLLEEKIHWSLQNWLWWLEGEALSASAVCAVCYAFRKSIFSHLPLDSIADDIHLALLAGSGGYGSRISRTAVATELRVPQTIGEFVEFRTRRGCDYSYELHRFKSHVRSVEWKYMVLFRRWLFLSIVPLLLQCIVLGTFVLIDGNGFWVLITAIALGLSSVSLLYSALRSLGSERKWRLAISSARFGILLLLSLMNITAKWLQGGTHAAKKASANDVALPLPPVASGAPFRSASTTAERL